jgi:tRNA (guanine-N(7)-)-methyltransferase subunit TRM82
MARRPSSIALTEDGLTILCADKFGDVYSLPLIPSPEEEEKEMLEREKKEQAKFVPSASVLTVHSGRNRKILEEQLKQAETKQLQARETPKFKHDLLLGHVSMLTDIVCTTYQGRSYIATADRDEHIRISRGLPQAHIIEGFCQGHDEFISRLCISKHKTHLVSGGGDAHLYVWDWLDRDSRNAPVRLIERLPIRDAVMDFYRKQGASAVDEKLKVAVSGIWAVPFNRPNDSDEILVACEGVPALFQFSLNNFRPHARGALPLAGNALDVAFVEHDKDTRVAVVSIDHVHQPGSTTEIRDDKVSTTVKEVCC